MKRTVVFILLVLTAALAAGSVWLFAFYLRKDPCADGHHFEYWEVTLKATCGTPGKQISTCTVCGAEGEEEIPPTGEHRAMDWKVSVAATLTEQGERVKKCKRCDQVLERATITPIGETIPVVIANGEKTVNIAEYDIVYDEDTSLLLHTQTLKKLQKALKAATGEELALLPQIDRPSGAGYKEILVGSTNRAESESAKAKIKGDGFIIEVSENKIVILGTDAMQTVCAVQHFLLHYVMPHKSGATLSLDTTVQADNVEALTLATSDYSECNLVFAEGLDNDPSHKYVSSSTSDSRDYPCVTANDLSGKLMTLTGLGKSSFPVRNDSKTTTLEVLIGASAREEVKYFLSLMDGNEYGILAKDGQVLLMAWTDYALKICAEQFMAMLEYSESETDGVSRWTLPNGFYAIGVAEESWIVDFPRPTGEKVALCAAQYVNDTSLQFVYTGEDVNAALYASYCDTLLAAGYTVLTQNSVEDSHFKTLVNSAKGVTLYVAYNHYKYEEEYKKDDEFDQDYAPCIRIVSAPTSAVTLPDAALLNSNPAYAKITDTKITALSFSDKAVGMGYVIMLEDGRFVVIDGGGVNSGGTEHVNLWNAMRELYIEAHEGQPPTAAKPIHIAAWITTHSHWDHYYAFFRMLQSYGSSGLLKMDYLFGNFPEWSALNSVPGSTLEMGKAATIALLQGRVNGGFKYIKVHTGQKLRLANLEIEILMTYEDHLPRRIDNSNDSCTVTRMKFFNSEKPANAPVTAVFLADAFRFQSRYLCAMYGSYLESDIVQLSHHGNIGCEQAVYDTIKPSVVYFPNDAGAFGKYTAGVSKSWNYRVDHHVVHELSSVHYVYVAVAGTNLTLTLSPNGPLYDEIYDVITKAPIVYDNTYFIKK